MNWTLSTHRPGLAEFTRTGGARHPRSAGADLPIEPIDPPQWLGEPNLAMAAIIFVHAWRLLPFATVILIAGLASIPPEVDDAAKVDGATGLKKLWYVSLPLQLPIAMVAILFGIVFTATDMAVVYILTHGGPFNWTQMLTDLGLRDRDPAGARRRAPPSRSSCCRSSPSWRC